MKALTLIPKKIKDKYMIKRTSTWISINKPAYVNIDFDDEFKIDKDKTVINIKNSKCVITLWIEIFNLHITIL